MQKLDVKCDSEIEAIINKEINSISDELREISLDVNLCKPIRSIQVF